MIDWIGPCLVVLVLIAAVFVLYRLAFNHGYDVSTRQWTALPPKSRESRTPLGHAVNVPSQANSVTAKDYGQKCDECRVIGGHHPQCPKAKEEAPKPMRRNWTGFSRIKRELESKETA